MTPLVHMRIIEQIEFLSGAVMEQEAALRYFEGAGAELCDALLALFANADASLAALRWDMGYALLLIGERERTIPALVEALRSEDSGVRWAAADYIGYFDANDHPGVLDALKDDDPDARVAAAYVLQDTSAQVSRAGAVEALIAALDDPQANVRLAAVKALYRIGTAGCMIGLEKVIDDAVGGVRTAARWALLALAGA